MGPFSHKSDTLSTELSPLHMYVCLSICVSGFVHKINYLLSIDSSKHWTGKKALAQPKTDKYFSFSLFLSFFLLLNPPHLGVKCRFVA